MTYKLGKLPNNPNKPRLTYKTLFAGEAIPDAPPKANWTTKVASFPMFLNDQIGDCTCAGIAHMVEVWTSDVSTESTITDNDVLTAYEAVSGYNPQTGANDNGAVMQEVLNYWRKNGVAGHSILAFAEIKVSDLNAVRHAIHTFGQVYIGMSFPAFAMDQFNQGEPWDVSNTNTNIEGGHCVVAGQYDADAKTITVVTWGARQVMTEDFWNKYVDECWVAVTKDWIDANGQAGSGVSLDALGQEYTNLTKQPSPFPDQPPAPTPVPPNPVEPPADVDTELGTALTKFLKTHSVPKYVREPAQNWLSANGL